MDDQEDGYLGLDVRAQWQDSRELYDAASPEDDAGGRGREVAFNARRPMSRTRLLDDPMVQFNQLTERQISH